MGQTARSFAARSRAGKRVGPAAIWYFSSGSGKRPGGAVWPETVEIESIEATRMKRLAEAVELLIVMVGVVKFEV